METTKLLSKAVAKGGVLVTIIRVEGSAYRKQGAMMLVTKAGEQIGMISASCLEADVAIRAEKLLGNNQSFSEIIVYDMSHEDDLGWGRGAGCNGKVHVLLEKIDTTLLTSLKEVLLSLEKGTAVTVYKDLQTAPNKIRAKYLTHHGGRLDIHNNKDMFVTPYIQTFQAPHRLIVFGVGFDAIPLLKIANQVGFEVYAWDWRPEQLKQARQYATEISNWQQFKFHFNDYVVVMTHDFQKDTQLIRYLLQAQNYRYFGVLGPRRRLERIMVDKEIPSFIHNPIGLSIGAEGATEIAISIMAELIKTKRKGVSVGEKSDWDLFSGWEKHQVSREQASSAD